MKREREEEERRKLQEKRRLTVEYYENNHIKDFIFTSVKGGRSTKPLLVGTVSENTIDHQVEIELHSLEYKLSYLRNFFTINRKYTCRVCETIYKSEEDSFEHLFSYHQKLVECLYPTFIGN